MKPRWIAMVATLLLTLPQGCDGGGEGSSSASSNEGSTVAATTSWSADTSGTSQVPAYGNSCRFEAASHIAIPGNAAADDGLELVKSGSAYDLSLALDDGAGGEASITATLSQGLARRSYRNGTGVAQGTGELGGLSGSIEDAAVCFETKLEPSEPTRGEFTIVVLNSSGDYVSLGGDFELPGEAVFPGGDISDEQLVMASALKVDLQ